jgi:Ca2+-binding EF-hand superfamily protein
MAMAMGRVDGPQAAGNSLGMSFYPLVNQGDRDRLPEILLALFDKDDDDKLNRKECGFDAATFARLDKNKDGGLDLDELAEWTKGPADLEFELVSPPQGGAALALKARGARFEKSCRQVSLVSCLVNTSDADITVQGRDTSSASALGQLQDLVQQFEMADKDERGYVELADLQDASLQTLKDFFVLMDRNHDGKLTEDEVRNLGLLLGEAPRYQAALAVFEQGRAFFQLLDANRDGYLSLHELRSAWSRLGPLDQGKKGYVTIEQIPRHFQIIVSRGSSQDLFNLGAAGGQGMAPPAARALLPSNVPEWFRKMDANGDGFISRREFLGSRADFNRIDSDGDGLIDPQEAIRFDAHVRGKVP